MVTKKEKTITMYRVCLSKTVAEPNYQLDLSFYSNIISVTTRYIIDYKLNVISNYYDIYIYFNTCKDFVDLYKLFGNDFDISMKLINERKIKNDTNDFNNE